MGEDDDDMNADDIDQIEHQDEMGDEFIDEIICAEDEDMGDGEEQTAPKAQVWRAGIDPLQEDEVLDFEPEAYTLYHKLRVEWPCLSMDILRDHLGNYRTKFPATLYAVTGSQADGANKNKVSVLKISQLHRMREDNPEEGINLEEEDDDDLDEDPIVEARSFKHTGSINRIRAMPQKPNVVATWADTGKVHIWNIDAHTRSLDNPSEQAPAEMDPVFSFAGHNDEGYAMDWSPAHEGRLATGGCDKKIFTYSMDQTGAFTVDTTPFMTHTASVEDLQWSPSESTVFASSSVDGTIKVWDIRQPQHKHMISINAHNTDVNVISWNRKVGYLLASGADDGSLKVWDLRNTSSPAALFEWHKKAVTSLQWHPHEESVLVASSEDNSVSIWDMALEADAQEVARESTGAALTDYTIPPQLLFIHQGQSHIKEVHFHPQIPSVILSTAYDGIDIFKPANMDVLLPPAAPGDANAAGN